jgi:hypothetical protein
MLHCRAAGPFSGEEAHRPRVVVGFVALAKVESGADGLERLHIPARPALQLARGWHPGFQSSTTRSRSAGGRGFRQTLELNLEPRDAGGGLDHGRSWISDTGGSAVGGRAPSGDRGVADGNGEDSGRFFGRWSFSSPDVCPVFLTHERFS